MEQSQATELYTQLLSLAEVDKSHMAYTRAAHWSDTSCALQDMYNWHTQMKVLPPSLICCHDYYTVCDLHFHWGHIVEITCELVIILIFSNYLLCSDHGGLCCHICDCP